jgi:hypothetical protein
VAVVEGDAEHSIPQRLDDLAFHLDLLFLDGNDASRLLDGSDVCRLRAFLTLAGFVFDLRALREGLEAVACDVRVVDEEILVTLVRADEAVALRIVEPLDGSGCHEETPPYPVLTNG